MTTNTVKPARDKYLKLKLYFLGFLFVFGFIAFFFAPSSETKNSPPAISIGESVTIPGNVMLCPQKEELIHFLRQVQQIGAQPTEAAERAVTLNAQLNGCFYFPLPVKAKVVDKESDLVDIVRVYLENGDTLWAAQGEVKPTSPTPSNTN